MDKVCPSQGKRTDGLRVAELGTQTKYTNTHISIEQKLRKISLSRTSDSEPLAHMCRRTFSIEGRPWRFICVYVIIWFIFFVELFLFLLLFFFFFEILWVSTLAYPNLFGTERLCCCCCYCCLDHNSLQMLVFKPQNIWKIGRASCRERVYVLV